MLRTRQIQDCVIDRDKEIGSRPAKSAREWRFTQKLDNVIADEPPKFTRRNPDTAAMTDDFC